DTTAPIALSPSIITGLLTYNKGYTYVAQRGVTGYDCSTLGSVTTLSGCNSANPQFVAADPSYWANLASFNLRLQASSPAIGAGTAVPYAAYDLIGNPHSATPSLGA